MNGYVMGGGYGHFSNFNLKISTENSIFSMPEVFIGGNIPNIQFLAELPKKYLSLYLVVTGF
jgi:enoyl-CoA hydratase/carnithine racemase